MSDAVRCDRCGSFYLKSIAVEDELLSRINIYSVENDQIKSYHDLCHFCLKDLYKFLNNEPVERFERDV